MTDDPPLPTATEASRRPNTCRASACVHFLVFKRLVCYRMPRFVVPAYSQKICAGKNNSGSLNNSKEELLWQSQ